MGTRVLLHGGYPGYWEGAGADVPLFQRLIDAALASDHKILISLCSYETPDEFPHLQQMQDTFRTLNPDISLTIAGRHNFSGQLGQHAVVFLQGGNSRAHHAFMENIPREMLTHKKSLVAGSSSGAMLLCARSISRNSQGVLTGKGIVNIGLIPHADAWDYQDALPLIQKHPRPSILLLNEMEMIEIAASF